MDGGGECTKMWMHLKNHWIVNIKMVKMVHFMLSVFYYNKKIINKTHSYAHSTFYNGQKLPCSGPF